MLRSGRAGREYWSGLTPREAATGSRTHRLRLHSSKTRCGLSVFVRRPCRQPHRPREPGRQMACASAPPVHSPAVVPRTPEAGPVCGSGWAGLPDAAAIHSRRASRPTGPAPQYANTSAAPSMDRFFRNMTCCICAIIGSHHRHHARSTLFPTGAGASAGVERGGRIAGRLEAAGSVTLCHTPSSRTRRADAGKEFDVRSRGPTKLSVAAWAKRSGWSACRQAAGNRLCQLRSKCSRLAPRH